MSFSSLRFEDRVAAQRAIEEVYWKHRIWPEANRTAKPSLDALLSASDLRAKVEDYLRESAALERLWSRPITAAQLQAELDRMARDTRQPEVLEELYAALEQDPLRIAECLARPVLVDRLLRSWYSKEDRFHGALRRRVEETILHGKGIDELRVLGDEYQDEAWSEANAEFARDDPPPGTHVLPSPDWERFVRRLAGRFLQPPPADSVNRGEPGSAHEILAALPLLRLSQVEEGDAGFSVTILLDASDHRIDTRTITWHKKGFDAWWREVRDTLPAPFDPPSTRYEIRRPPRTGQCTDDTWKPIDPPSPEARYSHTAVWTGSEMIVWGGLGYEGLLNSGGRYDPATDVWTPTDLGRHVPSPRSGHTAIWTGREMIVWGGHTGSGPTSSGGRYDPRTNRWETLRVDARTPSPRSGHAAVWTGKEMVVWGGAGSGGELRDGGRFRPGPNQWRTLSVDARAPSARSVPLAAWSGKEMIVWGGSSGGSAAVTGARYDPLRDRWRTMATPRGWPSPRNEHAGVWAGGEMIVWGFVPETGTMPARYDPRRDRWSYGSVRSGCPVEPVHWPIASWTGAEVLIVDGLTDSLRYDPVTDRCTEIRNPSYSLHAFGATAVWTGEDWIVWGGVYEPNYDFQDTGWRYSPRDGSWIPTRQGPAARYGHSMVWTGNEMIVWGGLGDVGSDDPFALGDGAKYSPSTGTWESLASLNAPGPRELHSAVWTGSEMIVWGGGSGAFGSQAESSGGRYDPQLDSWLATSRASGTPSARREHAAVWTGAEMIVWGNAGDGSGAKYDPLTDGWTALSTLGAPSEDRGLEAVWTGSEMIVWGNSGQSNGAKYDPETDTWLAVATIGAPSQRQGHTAVWTGNEMLVWGGADNTGGKYDPNSDAWTAISTVGAPSARDGHSAIWTGREMLVWGGFSHDGSTYSLTNTGGRYDPSLDRWRPTSVRNAPSARAHAPAVQTGSRVLIWGDSHDKSGGSYCSRACEPSTAATDDVGP